MVTCSRYKNENGHSQLKQQVSFKTDTSSSDFNIDFLKQIFFITNYN